MQVGEAFVAIRPDTKGFAGQLRGDVTAAGATAGTQAGQAIGRGLQAVLAGGLAVRFFQDAIGQASALNEAVSLTGVTFRGAAESVLDMGENSATSLGLANSEALNFATSIGGLFIGLGSTRTEAASMSQDVLQLGADLASAKNLSGGTAEALEILRAGLVGEVEPLRRVGVALNAAVVEQRALADTGKQSADQLTESEKAAARYALILESFTAQGIVGDFERTASGAANQQRIFNAELKNAQAELGQALLPAFVQVIGALRNGMPLLAQAGSFFTASAEGAAALASVAGPLAAVLGEVNGALSDVSAGVGDLGNVALGPLSSVVESIKALVETGIEFGGFSLGADGGFEGLIADTEGGVARIEELFGRLDVDFGAGSFEEFAEAIREAAGAAGIDLAEALDRLGISGDSAAQIIALVGVNTLQAGEAVGQLAAQNERLAEVAGRADIDSQAEALAGVAEAASDASSQLENLFGIQQSVAEGSIAIRDGARDLLVQLAELGEGGYRSQTESGDQFLSSLQDQAEAISEQTIAVAAQTGSIDQARAAQRGYIDSLIEVATAAGVPRREILSLIETFGNVPRRTLARVAQEGAQEVQQQAQGVTDKVNAIPPRKQVNIGVAVNDVALDNLEARLANLSLGSAVPVVVHESGGSSATGGGAKESAPYPTDRSRVVIHAPLVTSEVVERAIVPRVMLELDRLERRRR